MRKMLLCIEGTLLLVLIACWLAGLTNSGLVDAQISNPPHFLFGSTIASSLPAAVNANNQFWVVTDGASATDCSTGSGTTGVLCYSNGSTWASVGGAAASCSNALTMNNSNSGAASGATFNCSAAVALSANTLGAGSLANANTWSGDNGFTAATGSLTSAPIYIANAAPSIDFEATGQSANNKWWDFVVSGLTLLGRTNNDTNSSQSTWLTVTRVTGTTAIGSILLGGPTTATTLNVAAARKGTFVCTAGGTITISNTNGVATSDIVITMNTAGGTITTPPAFKTVTAGTGFTMLCGASDTSTYNYDILN